MKKLLLTAGLAALMLSTSLSATDDKAADAAKAHRHGLMQTIKNSALSMRRILTGELDQAENYSALATALSVSTGIAVDAFKENTVGKGKGHTVAKDHIWDNWEDFSARLEKMDVDAKALERAAENNNVGGSKNELVQLFKNCKSCHDEYRSEH